MALYILWSLRRLINAICDRLGNKFDVFLVIEGKRGLGKSTLAFIICRLVRFEMKRREVDGYKFSPKRDLLYTRKEVIGFFHKRQATGIADEMINVTFNRDFYNEEQKDLIKMINMNRDHSNLFIACVPQFKVLDTQIKNLCSMKITVVRRGVAIIHTPNKTVYASDIWDENVNEKIERKWLKSGVIKPQYVKLTTFRGYLKFPKLSEKQELIYQTVKDEKRNIVAKDSGFIEDVEITDPFIIIYNALMGGKIKNMAMLDGMIVFNDLNVDSIRAKIRRQLKADKKASGLATYFYDDREAKEEVKKERKRGELSALIKQVKGNA